MDYSDLLYAVVGEKSVIQWTYVYDFSALQAGAWPATAEAFAVR